MRSQSSPHAPREEERLIPVPRRRYGFERRFLTRSVRTTLTPHESYFCQPTGQNKGKLLSRPARLSCRVNTKSNGTSDICGIEKQFRGTVRGKTSMSPPLRGGAGLWPNTQASGGCAACGLGCRGAALRAARERPSDCSTLSNATGSSLGGARNPTN